MAILLSKNIAQCDDRAARRPRGATTARRDDRTAVGWAWTGRNLILDEALEQAVAYQQEWEAAVSDTHGTSQALNRIQVEFSEKHTCVAKEKIQGAHWEQH